MSQTQVFRGTARRKIHHEAGIAFYYHDTVVVKTYFDKIVLNSGGWMTATTKTAMNQASNEYFLGFSVYQEKGKWYVFVDANNKKVPFEDGMEIKR